MTNNEGNIVDKERFKFIMIFIFTHPRVSRRLEVF